MSNRKGIFRTEIDRYRFIYFLYSYVKYLSPNKMLHLQHHHPRLQCRSSRGGLEFAIAPIAPRNKRIGINMYSPEFVDVIECCYDAEPTDGLERHRHFGSNVLIEPPHWNLEPSGLLSTIHKRGIVETS